MKRKPITPGFFEGWKLNLKRPEQNLTTTFIVPARTGG